MKNYHNTTSLDGHDLINAIKNANTQDAMIVEMFSQYEKPMSACDVYQFMQKALLMPDVLLTSVRRSINTLLNEGLIDQVEETKIGMYKRKVHMYKIHLEKGQLEMFI